MDGFDVRPMSEAAEIGEVFITVTGNNEQTLWMLDLSTTGGQPVMVRIDSAPHVARTRSASSAAR